MHLAKTLACIFLKQAVWSTFFPVFFRNNSHFFFLETGKLKKGIAESLGPHFPPSSPALQLVRIFGLFILLFYNLFLLLIFWGYMMTSTNFLQLLVAVEVTLPSPVLALDVGSSGSCSFAHTSNLAGTCSRSRSLAPFSFHRVLLHSARLLHRFYECCEAKLA